MSILTDILTSVVTKIGCIVPVYCFMPDHQHLIITGTCSDSDIWKAIVSYKQKTGFWMSMNKTGIRWQKDFYDLVIRRHGDVAVQVRYILDNPVRKGLVSSWQDYPFNTDYHRCYKPHNSTLNQAVHSISTVLPSSHGTRKGVCNFSTSIRIGVCALFLIFIKNLSPS